MKELIPLLRQCYVFYQFTQTQLELVSNLCKEKTYRPGETIFVEKSNSTELYVILHGEVEILIDADPPNNSGDENNKISISNLRRGQSFGEISLVDEGLRSATARVKDKEARLIVIPREKLIMLCETYPQLGFRLMYNLAAEMAMKIRNTDFNIREKVIYGQQKM